MSILVTGASGFVGNALCARLIEQGVAVIGAVRRPPENPLPRVDYRIVADLSRGTQWRAAFAGADAVAHCAARVHVMCETEADPLMVFRKVNVEGTVGLAEQAVECGIKRFVYISSIKVNGETTATHPFKADDPPAPEDPYGISKWETEQALQKVSSQTGLEIVIVRPPLVYGPGVRANFLRLMQAVRLGVPLPLGAIHNRRSLVALDNLVDLIETCLRHPEAANQTFLVSDGDDLSTTELLWRTALALGRPARLIPIPTPVLRTAVRLLGKSSFTQRLCGSLQVDIRKTQDRLGWSPPVSVDEALRKAAKHFLADLKQNRRHYETHI